MTSTFYCRIQHYCSLRASHVVNIDTALELGLLKTNLLNDASKLITFDNGYIIHFNGYIIKCECILFLLTNDKLI